MSFARRLLVYCSIGAGTCVASQLGLLFCFFTNEWVGKYIHLPFLWLSCWPNFLFQPVFPKKVPASLDGLGWPINCVISLAGWIVLAEVVAIIAHAAKSLRPRPTQRMSQ